MVLQNNKMFGFTLGVSDTMDYWRHYEKVALEVGSNGYSILVLETAVTQKVLEI